jgi:hypothetical protein
MELEVIRVSSKTGIHLKLIYLRTIGKLGNRGYVLYQPFVVVAVFPTPKPNVGAAGVDPKLKAIVYVSLVESE